MGRIGGLMALVGVASAIFSFLDRELGNPAMDWQLGDYRRLGYPGSTYSWRSSFNTARQPKCKQRSCRVIVA